MTVEPAAPASLPGTQAPVIGVLFIHGMGAQGRGDTLADFGEPLAIWARQWFDCRNYDASPNAGLTDCDCGDDDRQPLHVHCQWPPTPNRSDSISVILTESWWAEEFKAVPSTRLISWLPSMVLKAMRLGILLAALTGAALAIGAAALTHGTMSAAIILAFITAVGIVLLSLVLAPLALVLGSIEPTSKFFKPVVNFLTSAVGDVMIYQKHPFTALRARQKIVGDFEWLAGKASKTIVAAHSLGSLLAVDALGSTTGHCNQLWTFGSAIKLLRNDRASLVANLRSRQREMQWSNFYDTMDLISGSIGPCDASPNFPTDTKIDNGRSVFMAHTTYPLNTEQFLIPLIARIEALRDDTRLGAASSSDMSSQEVSPAEVQALKNLRWRWWARRLLTLFGVVTAMTTALVAIHFGWPGQALGDASRLEFLPQQIRDLMRAWGSTEGILSLGTIVVATILGSIAVLIHRAIANLLLSRLRRCSLKNLAARKVLSPSLRTLRVVVAVWGALLPLVAALGLSIYVNDDASRWWSSTVFVGLPLLAVMLVLHFAQIKRLTRLATNRIDRMVNSRFSQASANASALETSR